MGALWYMDNESRREIQSQIDHHWELQEEQLQSQLEPLPLSDALRYLAGFHRENGFLEEDLSKARIFSCIDPDHSSRRFIAQFNPRRGQRVGVGRTGGCVLDVQHLRRQQRGLQFYYRFALNDRLYDALVNPFLFAPSQTTIASEVHEPQGWYEGGREAQSQKIRRIVDDLFALAHQLPGWVGVYNGKDAGATIDHLHFHVFELPPGHGPFPLQLAAEQVRTTPEAEVRLRFGGDSTYPVTAFRFGGSGEHVVQEASALLERYTNRDPQAATANLMAVREGAQTCMYVVPRNRFLESAAGFASRVGSLEVFGEFICSSEEELHALQKGRISFRRLWNILKAINPPTIRDL